MQCWKCETPIGLAPHSRVSRNDSCSHCHSDLHVCKNCRFHDPTVHNQCRETQAEWVSDRERANFCDYLFTLRDNGRRLSRGRRPRRQVGL